MKQNLTRQQYDKLTIDCETQYGGTWYKNKKFVRRGRVNVVVAFLDNNGHPLTAYYSVGNVRINGVKLAYNKYHTNSKSPQPFEPDYSQNQTTMKQQIKDNSIPSVGKYDLNQLLRNPGVIHKIQDNLINLKGDGMWIACIRDLAKTNVSESLKYIIQQYNVAPKTVTELIGRETLDLIAEFKGIKNVL